MDVPKTFMVPHFLHNLADYEMVSKRAPRLPAVCWGQAAWPYAGVRHPVYAVLLS